jgi:NADPH:quinone reductase-like Zn-dependent oxidoreductase
MNAIPDTVDELLIVAPGRIGMRSAPVAPLADGQFFVRTLYTGISAGTELTFFAGTNPRLGAGWDGTHRLFRDELEPDPGQTYPLFTGDMESAVVTASRHRDVPVGTRIASMYGHASGQVLADDGPWPWVELPAALDPRLGVWPAHLGPVCLNGILVAADEVCRAPLPTLRESLRGQRVIVFGAGMIGLCCALVARWAGATDVAVVDGVGERLAVARRLGLLAFEGHPGLPLAVKRRWTAEDPLDTGADIALQCSGSDALLGAALACLREQGTVVDLGFYQGGAGGVWFGREFHHNRLRHVCAQIGAVPRRQRGGWDKRRLVAETVSCLLDQQRAFLELITHDVPFSQGQQVFDRLAARDPAVLQVVLHPDP